MGAPLSVENSTDSANEAAQSGLRPGHPCGVPPDKPAPPPAQMAGLRPGLFTRGAATAARCAPNRQGHQGAQEGRRGVFLQVCRVRQGEALKTRLRRFLELSTNAETVLRAYANGAAVWQKAHTSPTPADGRRAGERRLQRLPPIPPPFPPAGRERVALCRQGYSRRGASLPCLPPAGERWAAPAASRGRVLALRAAGRTNPLTRHPLKNRVQEVAQ